jgi:neutral ceramidase
MKHFRSLWIPLILVLITLGCPPAICSAEPAWKAGLARRNITPTEPLWLSGYGSRDHTSEGTRLPLWGKVLALESADGQRAMIISLDVVGLDRETAQQVRQELQAKAGIQADRIAICSSHTHTGPVVGRNLDTMYFFSAEEGAKIQRYTRRLQEHLIQAGEEAVRNLTTAHLSWGVGWENFGVNRRNNPEPLVRAHRAAGKLRGPVDYDVPILRITDAQDQLTALIFGYACHATVLDDYLFSGDYPGFAQAELERRHPGVQAMFLAGCGADINPLPRRTPELAEQYGRRLADAVDRGTEGVLTSLSPRLEMQRIEIDLPYDTLPSKDTLLEKVKSTDKYVVAYAKKMLRQLDSQGALPKSYPYPLSVWRLGGNLTWIALGGEVVVDYSLRLKRELGSGTWVSGYSHDVMAYIPSRRVWDEGGYEGGGAMIYYGLPTRWASDAEERIIEAVKRLTTGVR